MSKILKGVMLIIVVVGLSGCVSTGDINVSQAKYEKANIDGYKTYMALLPDGIILDSKGTWVPKNIDVSAEIQHMIKTEMDKKGKRQVVSDPDFYVMSVVGVDIDALKEKVTKKDQIQIENIPAAGLAIVFVDAKTNQVIWMSVAEGDLKDELSIEKRKKRASYAIKKMLESI